MWWGVPWPSSTARMAAIDEMALEDWRACLSGNLDGAFLAAKHVAPVMKAQRAGAMIFTSSRAGLYGFPYRAPYAAAKWGVIGLMKTVAMELGPHGIRANAICPGSVEGARIDRVFAAEAEAKGMTIEAVRAGYAAGTALGRLAQAGDMYLTVPAAFTRNLTAAYTGLGPRRPAPGRSHRRQVAGTETESFYCS